MIKFIFCFSSCLLATVAKFINVWSWLFLSLKFVYQGMFPWSHATSKSAFHGNDRVFLFLPFRPIKVRDSNNSQSHFYAATRKYFSAKTKTKELCSKKKCRENALSENATCTPCLIIEGIVMKPTVLSRRFITT